MKLDSRMLVLIADNARYEMHTSIKHRHESHEEHLARCWIVGMMNVFSKEGKPLDITLPNLGPEVVEPLDED